MRESIINISYLVAAVLFIVCFKMLSHPRKAIRGNMLGAIGMLIAVAATFLLLGGEGAAGYGVILGGVVVGGVIGALLALKIRMTAMPQMVALLNGFGGAASVLVAGAALLEALARGQVPSAQFTVATALAGIIGAVTFFGSLVAFAKLEELIGGQPVLFAGQGGLNGALLLAALALGGWLVATPETVWLYWVIVAAAAVLGVTGVLPIGGADMPVVITLLNSYSGLAAADAHPDNDVSGEELSPERILLQLWPAPLGEPAAIRVWPG